MEQMSGSVREKADTKKLVFGRISVDKLNGNDRSGLSGELNKYEGSSLIFMVDHACFDHFGCSYLFAFGQATFKGNVFSSGYNFSLYGCQYPDQSSGDRKKQIKPGLSYIIIKLVDILLLVILVNIVNHGYMFYFAILLPIISICITRGFKTSVPYLGVAIVFHIAVHFIVHRFDNIFYLEYFTTQHAQYLFLIGILYLYSSFLRLLEPITTSFHKTRRTTKTW